MGGTDYPKPPPLVTSTADYTLPIASDASWPRALS